MANPGKRKRGAAYCLGGDAACDICVGSCGIEEYEARQRSKRGSASKSRGTQRELAVRDWLRDRDWLAFRAPASLGVADVVALKDGSRPRLVEVKSTVAGPYHAFVPKDRERLRFAARLAGADAYLAWWPIRGELRWLHESEWPGASLPGVRGEAA